MSPTRKAWFAYASDSARRTAPSGRSNVSPCHCSERNVPGRPANSGSASPLGGQRHVADADLRHRARVHVRAERRREQLHAEAGAEERHAGRDGLADQHLLTHQPGMVGLVVGAHRAAHRDDRVESAPVGQPLALVELDADDLRAAFPHHVLVDGGRLTGDVLEHQDVHAATTLWDG